MKKQFLYLFAIAAITISSCSKKSDPKPDAIASFEISSTQLFLEQEVSFKNESQFADSYSWDFGDGNKSEKKEPVHKYSIPGEYKVSLTVNGKGSLNKTVKVHDADRAVYLSNAIKSDLDITLFDRVSVNEIGNKRYKFGIVKSNTVSDTLYIKDTALGIAGIQGILSFVILDPMTFDLEKGKVNKLEINSNTKVFYGLGLPEWK